jgi:hypothetical protein
MIRKALAIIALVMIASLSVAGCTQNSSTSSPTPTPTITSKATVIGNNTTFSSSTGFNITYPKTLKTDSNNSADTKIMIYLGTNNSTSISVSTEPVNPNATSLDYATYYIGSINNYPDYQLVSNQSTTSGGKPAYTIVWQATLPVQPDPNSPTIQNTTLKVMQTYVVNNNTGYIVTYKAIPSDYNTYLAQAQPIMNSFKLTS